MALRLIEAIIPADRVGELPGLFQEGELLGMWTATLGEKRAAVRILVPTENTEAITDRLTGHFELDHTFRLMLFSVEATLPLPEADEEEPEKEQTGAKDQPERISREELYQTVARGGELSPVYVVTVLLSTVVAAVGLIRGDVAIIIGAMVIAPLLGPNVALALASTLGDLSLAVRAGKTIAAGMGATTVLSILIGLSVDVNPQVPDIASRTSVHVGDVLLALAAGSAGTLAVTTGIPAAVIGVMVAVALLPPLVVFGLLLGAGHGSLAFGALILFVTNITCINLAGVGTFLAQKIRPRNWWEKERAKKATRFAGLLWALMLAMLLAVMFLFL